MEVEAQRILGEDVMAMASGYGSDYGGRAMMVGAVAGMAH